MITQEFTNDGGEFKLTSRINTDENERANWRQVQDGKGFIRDSKGQISGRLIMQIPEDEAAMLRANYDLDWLAFEQNGDKAAMKRLLARFPYWRCSGGEV